MEGFNLLGLNQLREKNTSKHPYDLINDVLKDASKELDSFKEVELALTNIYTKEEVDALLLGYTPGEDGSVSLANYLTKLEASTIYQPKGNYLEEHQSLENYAKKGDVSEFIKMSDVEAKNYLTSQSLNGYVKTSEIPTSLPASDVSDWAKAESKPEYTAEEVGAASSEHNHDGLYLTLEAFDLLNTRLTALEGNALPVAQPYKYYVGFMGEDGVNSPTDAYFKFADVLGFASGINNLTCEIRPEITQASYSTYYIMIPDVTKVTSIVFVGKDGIDDVSFNSTEIKNDFTSTHPAVTVNGVVYNVYGYRSKYNGVEKITVNIAE